MVIDILVGLVLFLSALISFLRGFIREVLTIFGTVGALAAAYYTGPTLEPLMRGWLGVKEGEPAPELFDIIPYTILAQIMAYGSVFLIVLIVLSIISHILAETARKIGLGAIDRTLGVIFGLARGFVILALIYIPLKLFAGPERIDNWFEGSKTHLYIDLGATWITDLLPENTLETGDVAPSESEAREKLEKMKLLNPESAKKIEESLKNGLKPEEILKSLGGTGSTGSADEKGYTEEFRKQMDELFKDKNKTAPPAGGVAEPPSLPPQTPETPVPAHDTPTKP
ncbi:MAG: CvpA family protein [Alphaproteobacteria bacterium]|nr:CvpA family protein [Alphaproteobacteria bacterium]